MLSSIRPLTTSSTSILLGASLGVTEEGGVCCCLLLPSFHHNLHTYLCFSSLSIFINYRYPKYDCYICLKYVEEKRHCTTLNKWWSDNDMMMLGRNIIVQHHIAKWWSDNDMMMLGRNIIVQHHIAKWWSDNDMMMLGRITIA